MIPIMDISCLMVHAQQIEVEKLKQVGKELKRTRAKEGNSFKNRFEVLDKPRFKNRFPNQSRSTTPRVNKVEGLRPSLKREKLVVPMLRSLLVLNVAENMKESV